ncbi:MAG: hypothetical protein WC480_01020 [Patescibacteria group bacterium]
MIFLKVKQQIATEGFETQAVARVTELPAKLELGQTVRVCYLGQNRKWTLTEQKVRLDWDGQWRHLGEPIPDQAEGGRPVDKADTS